MLIPLKLVRDQPLQQQLYEQLRDLIVSARLAGGTRMPSTRMLADQFSVSRITVLLTYERLIAEGYLATVPAKGTFVSPTRPVQTALPASKAVDAGRGVPSTAGRPDARLFPSGRWRALVRDSLDFLGANLAADHPDGDPALRRAIAGWLSTSRGLAVDPDQVILANGRQHALHVAAHMLLHPGVRAVIESPSDPRSEELVGSTGAAVVRVPVDESGLQTELLPPGAVAMALVTPEHQRPLGVVMGPARRQALLAWAERSGTIVVADDIDGELRYETMDPPLMSLDRDGRVIHLGGFALSLGPGIRHAYLAVPRPLIARARAASRLVDDHASRLETTALANLLETGAYARHLHQLRKVYLSRRDTLISALRRHFGPDIRLGGHAGGLHFVWHLPAHLGHAGVVAGLARGHGLDAVSFGMNALQMGFGTPADTHMDLSVSRLSQALAMNVAVVAGE